MSIVFLDTVGLIAQWDADDQWHALAETVYWQMVADRKSVLTTTFILLECGNTAARRTFRSDVRLAAGAPNAQRVDLPHRG
jgi:hypothetical protein